MAIEPATSSLAGYRHCLVARRIKHLERVTQGRMLGTSGTGGTQFSLTLFPRPFRDVCVVGFSWKSPHTTTAFVGPSNRFDLRRLRFLPVESGPDPVNVDRLLQLGHEGLKVLLAGVQDLAQFRAGPHRLLIRIPSFRKKRKVFNERSSVPGELVQRFRVRRHGW